MTIALLHDGGSALHASPDLDALYREHGDRLLRLCRSILGPTGDAEDAAHEAILKAWASRHRHDPDRPIWPWLAAIARNTCIDHQRRRAAAARRAVPTDVAAPDPAELAVKGAGASIVRDALGELPASSREVLLLRFVEELDYHEIAARQQRSQGAVRVAVARARKELRTRVETLARSRGTWPLAGFGGLVPELGWLGRCRDALHRHAAHATARGGAVVDHLAAVAHTGPGRAAVGGLVALTLLLSPADDDPTPPSHRAPEALAPPEVTAVDGAAPSAVTTAPAQAPEPGPDLHDAAAPASDAVPPANDLAATPPSDLLPPVVVTVPAPSVDPVVPGLPVPALPEVADELTAVARVGVDASVGLDPAIPLLP